MQLQWLVVNPLSLHFEICLSSTGSTYPNRWFLFFSLCWQIVSSISKQRYDNIASTYHLLIFWHLSGCWKVHLDLHIQDILLGLIKHNSILSFLWCSVELSLLHFCAWDPTSEAVKPWIIWQEPAACRMPAEHSQPGLLLELLRNKTCLGDGSVRSVPAAKSELVTFWMEIYS